MVKTLLQEASTLGKALENAWQEAGRPAEFSAKILKKGESSFFGLYTNKPYVVCLNYNSQSVETAASGDKPKSQYSNSRSQNSERPERNDRADRNSGERMERPVRRERDNRDARPTQERSESSSGERSFDRNDRRQPRHVSKTMYANNRPAGRSEVYRSNERDNAGQQVEEHVEQIENWSPELEKRAIDLLIEIAKNLGNSIQVSNSSSGNNLTLLISERLLEDDNFQKSLFVSISTLIMQILRREFAQSVRGLRLLIKHEQN